MLHAAHSVIYTHKHPTHLIHLINAYLTHRVKVSSCKEANNAGFQIVLGLNIILNQTRVSNSKRSHYCPVSKWCLASILCIVTVTTTSTPTGNHGEGYCRFQRFWKLRSTQCRFWLGYCVSWLCRSTGNDTRIYTLELDALVWRVMNVWHLMCGCTCVWLCEVHARSTNWVVE